MNIKKKTRFTSMLLALIMVFSTIVSVPAYAASKTQALPSLSAKKYIQAYTIKSSGKVFAYTDSSLKKQKGSNWWIDSATDECRIVKVTATAVQVYYPIGNGKWVSQPQWFKRSDFTATDISKAQSVKLTTSRITTYRRGDGKTSYGSTGSGDQIYVLGSSGNYTQIVYELSNGNWKMGWIRKTDANKYLKDVSTNSSGTASVSQNAKSFVSAVSKIDSSILSGTSNAKATTKASTNKITASNENSAKAEKFFQDDRWKAGTYWGSLAGTKGTKLSNYKGWQCCAYAQDFIKYVYDRESYLDASNANKPYNTVDGIRSGDVIRVYVKKYEIKFDNKGKVLSRTLLKTGGDKKSGLHWAIVMGVSGDTYDIIEANVYDYSTKKYDVATRRNYSKWYDPYLKKNVLLLDVGGDQYWEYEIYRGYTFN